MKDLVTFLEILHLSIAIKFLNTKPKYIVDDEQWVLIKLTVSLHI